MKRTVLLVVVGLSVVAACGGDTDEGTAAALVVTDGSVADEPAGDAPSGVVSVAPSEAAAVVDGAPDDLVVLDIRTPEEFAEGHLDGAVMLDFYDPAFADELAALDRDVPYVLYCRSGNRSGQVLPVMEQLGFTSVTEIAGGIVAWQADGLPVTTD